YGEKSTELSLVSNFSQKYSIQMLVAVPITGYPEPATHVLQKGDVNIVYFNADVENQWEALATLVQTMYEFNINDRENGATI
ncbi:unnamed protein product, partial [marine sediment metagenome]